jgi:hypothetical protein
MTAGLHARALSGGSAIPAASCPVTQQAVILPAYLWTLKRPIRMNCPACGCVHLWDPITRRLAGVADADRR